MTKHNNICITQDASNAPTTDSRFPHELSSTTEREILLRVQQRVLPLHATDPQPQQWMQRILWSTGSLAATSLALLAFFWFTPSSSPLQVKQLTQTNNQQNGNRLFEGKATTPGRISYQNKWSLSTQGNTSFILSKSSPDKQELYLNKGHVNVHVTPKTMKHFAIHANGFAILVKGTRFNVQRGKKWVRTEVWKGKVLLRKNKALQRSITKGQGCRAKHDTITCYTLPPYNKRKPSKRILWLATHQPDQLVTYAKDMLTSSLSKRKSIRLLRQSIEHLQAQQFNQQALTLYLLLANQKVTDSNQALLDAALLCKRTKRADSTTCQSILQQCLKECSDPLWREQSHGLWLQTLSTQAKTPTQHAQMQRQLKQYLNNYPNGSWRTKIGRLLIRHGAHLQQTCKTLRTYLQQGDKGETWFRKRCP